MSAEIASLHVPFESVLWQRGIEFIRARSDRESTIEAGWPDFTVLHPWRGPLLLEMKDKNTPVSAVQKKVHARLASHGFTVHVVRELATAFRLLDEWFAQGGEVEPVPARGVASRMTIRNRPGHGDWVYVGDEPSRKATIDDLKTYPRK